MLVIWNRYADRHELASRFEAAGGTVLVAENAYLDADRDNRQRYALAVHAHNGRGRWPAPGNADYGARWRALSGELRLQLETMRLDGDHVLVAPNRSFGMPGGVMPADWAETVARQLRTITRRPVRVRPHPGNDKPAVPFSADLAGAHAVVIWSSSVGVQALLAGVQVLCLAPWWICKAASHDRLADLDQHLGGDRLPALERLAWAQWGVEEISAGEPFRYLLPDSQQAESAQTS